APGRRTTSTCSTTSSTSWSAARRERLSDEQQRTDRQLSTPRAADGGGAGDAGGAGWVATSSAPPQGARDRVGADRHRAGGGVRLRGHPGVPLAARGGRRDGPRELEPGHD